MSAPEIRAAMAVVASHQMPRSSASPYPAISSVASGHFQAVVSHSIGTCSMPSPIRAASRMRSLTE